MIIRWLLLIAICCQGVAFAQSPCGPQGCPVPSQYEPRLVPVPPQPSPTLPQNNPPSSQVNASVVRVHCGDWSGSGSLIDKQGNRGLVLSAAHVVNPRGERYVVFYSGQRGTVHEVYTDRTKADLCAFDVDLSADIAALPVSAIMPVVTEPVTTIGYGGGSLGWWNCQYLGEWQTTNGQRLYTLSGVVRQGDSGGPVLNNQWEVCGVISGRNDEAGPQVIGPGYQTTCEFIQRARDKWRAKVSKIGDKLMPTNPGETPGKAPEKPADKLPDTLDGVASAVESFTVRKIMEAIGLSTGGVVGWAAAAGLGFLLHRANKKLKAKVEGVIKPAAGETAIKFDLGEVILGQLGELRHKIETIRQPQAPARQEPPAIDHSAGGGPDPYVIQRPIQSQVVRKNRAIPVETDFKDKAWADAVATLMDQKPAWVPILREVEDLRNQNLAGVIPALRTLEENINGRFHATSTN